MTRPFFSVVVPTYNRPQHLAPLLDSVLGQSFTDWEVVIGDDNSPQRDAVRAIVADYAARTGGRVRAEFHEKTFGYDKNLRTVMRAAAGKYLFIMGDDDYVAPGALQTAAAALHRHPDTGMILRSFAWFIGEPSNVVSVTRYYPETRVFPAGRSAILACYRRVVVMSGLVFDRDLAVACETDRWDGSLFYQHWVAGNVLARRPALFLPDLLVIFRRGSPRSFGTAAAEQGLYTPGAEPPDTTYKGVRFQFEIARALEQANGLTLMDDLLRDYANYSYPQAAGHAKDGFKEYFAFYRRLGSLGLSRYASYHAWFALVWLVGARRVEWMLNRVRRILGHTPNLSRSGRAGSRADSVSSA